ncbi:helix-turn-helix transcriptional regulator [Pseudomonas sp. LPB0260]|uniref:LuxR C-terminal-related transcriptional regulator n=1 Tax=Pseudomonas sp. LPB0260 TaxID=2614442 RepID=UPI0015C24314|nr:LuxR C-terminal-related transcriptional regulator [Pseudomonas sp. LPB0260]QLC72570.1 helix-turn-helix transcriptional regulator [Pseudomonas sp. LPB0260]
MDETLGPAAGSPLHWKFGPPEASIEALPRPRIEAALSTQPHARVLLFSAPAGFGKTWTLSALAQQKASAGYAVAWLSLDADDDEPARFFLHLIEALESLVPGLGLAARGYLQNTMGVPVAAVTETLLADLAQVQAPLLLVLDDLHLIQNTELLAALERLIRYAPAGFVLALASRSQPALKLATLRAKGLLLEIGEGELRLSQAETGDYLARHGLQLEAPALAALYRHTEGWVVGVHLASLWLRQQPQAWQQLADLGTSPATVGDYLLRTVFEQLPADQQQLLEALGIAQQLCGDLANTLAGRQDGQQMLEALEAMQLFLLPLDRQRHWYRFHNLFAEFLRRRLQGRDPERFKQLHFKASLWFATHRMQNLAIEHACLAEDPRMLAALVDGCGLELINRGQLHLIYKWRQHVPDEIAQDYPMLVLADVWSRAAELDLAEANRMLDEQLHRWRMAEAAADLEDSVLATLTIKALIALQKDDLPGCVALARRVELQLGGHTAFLEMAMLIVGALANVVLGEGESARRLLALAQQRNHFLEGHYLGMQLANVEVLLCLQQGQIKRAGQLFAQLRARTAPCFATNARALALPTISGALIDYHQGRLEGVEERLRWALATVDVINPVDLYAQGMLCLAQVQRALGKPKEARATLLRMQQLAAGNRAWRFQAQALGDEVTQLLQEPGAERLTRAEQRLNDVDWPGLAGHYRHLACNPVLWVRGLTRIRLLQARDHHSEALHEIAQLRGPLQDDWHGLQRLRLDLLAALSHQHLGYQERAQSLLVQCLSRAEHDALRSLFIEEGAPVRRLLSQLEAGERYPALQAFIRSILAIWPGQDALQAEVPLAEGLTEREAEVIQLAAQGLANDSIGQRLALALGTVKWHLHNIYEKLGVRNRTQAIRRAQELGLVAP